jgi:predicted nucleic acid-binding protein
MADLLLVDTDILVDAARGQNAAIAYLEAQEQKHLLAISAITEMELVVGCRNKQELRKLDRSLTRFQIVALRETISSQAAALLRQYALSHGLRLPDALIAATAMSLDVLLATKNRKDFRYIEGVRLARYSTKRV